LGIAQDDGLPETEKPDARPPCGVRLAVGERQHAERHNKENALYPEGNGIEEAGRQEIQEKSLEREEKQKNEATGGGHGNERSRKERQRARVLLPAARYYGGEKYRPGKIDRENIAAEQNRQRAGFRHEDVAGADGKTGKCEAIAAVGK